MAHSNDLVFRRLWNQGIIAGMFARPEDVVRWHGAMQAQDYHHAQWAVGLRLPGSSSGQIERALDEGRIVRTHVLRPTWHLVAAADVRWMLALSAPQIAAVMAPYNQKLGLHTADFSRIFSVLTKSLEGRQHRTRSELMTALENAGIATGGLRSVHIMMQAEIEGLVCNGIRRGKQQTYALLDEKIPATGSQFDRPAALAELACRYFNSHAPATLQDFYWWSGLKMTEARAGLEAAMPGLVAEKVGDTVYYLPDASHPQLASNPALVHLLPAFDEFLISYKDRSAVLAPLYQAQVISGNGIFRPVILARGIAQGIWQRVVQKKQTVLQTAFFRDLDAAELESLLEARQRLESFWAGEP